MALNQAYIVDAIRSPTGRRKGGLGHIHGADLGAHVLNEIVQRNGIPDVDYDDIIFGCVDTIGPLAGDIARTAWLAAGLPNKQFILRHKPSCRALWTLLWRVECKP
jgi:acetyl-CoA C-acetyltransferase